MSIPVSEHNLQQVLEACAQALEQMSIHEPESWEGWHESDTAQADYKEAMENLRIAWRVANNHLNNRGK